MSLAIFDILIRKKYYNNYFNNLSIYKKKLYY